MIPASVTSLNSPGAESEMYSVLLKEKKKVHYVPHREALCLINVWVNVSKEDMSGGARDIQSSWPVE